MSDQEFRIESDSPANGDLMFWSIAGHEALSRPAAYELAVLSRKVDIAPRDILGRAFDVVIVFSDADGGSHERHCQGHAVRFTRLAQVGRFYEYRIALRSWFGLLAKRTNSRILQDKPILEVLDAVLEDSPIQRFKKLRTDDVLGVHKPRRYCVQHQETDYGFLSRLLEDEGIYYWFDAHDAPGTMMLADASDVAHGRLPAGGTLRYEPSGSSEARYNEITRWITVRQFDTGLHATRDSDFKAIRKRLATDKDVQSDHELADFENFEFPGGYFSGEDGDTTAKLRGEELDARRQRHWALTGWPDVAVGRTFHFEGDPDSSRDSDYLIAACTFAAAHPGYESEVASQFPRPVAAALRRLLADDAVNADTHDVLEDLLTQMPEMDRGNPGGSAFLLTLLPANLPFRPPRLTARVQMPGPQTAIVVGGEGKEHDVDAFGRVKVHFHWDRYDSSDERSTCWLRVSQPWAGKGWGGYFAPRIGQEVIVEFLNGDPDRPVVTGRVYNDDQPIPYKSATQSGFKTHSTPQGSPRNFNELRFEDRKDGEQVFIHAERRMDVRVKRDKYETVQGTSQTWIGGAHALTIGQAMDWKIGAALFQKTAGKYDCAIGANLTLGIEGDLAAIVKGKVEINAKQMTLEALTSITLKVGANFVRVDAAGITIQGSIVKINSGGGAAGTGSPDIEDPLDAATADNGEPGYLDRLPKGGKAAGRNKHSLQSQHALPYTQTVLPGGDIRLGNGLVVKSDPNDPTFQQKALRDLATIAATEQGSATLNGIDQSGKKVTVAPQDPAHAFNQCGADSTDDASPKGPTYYRDQSGTQHPYEGTGNGSGSTVYWKPDDGKKMANGEDRPSDVSLHHELGHAEHNAKGTASNEDPVPPDDTIADNREEVQNIRQDNEYRKERGLPTRPNHATL